eukprot:gene44521-54448_t
MDILSSKANGILTIEFNRLERKNAITTVMYQAMADALRAADAAPDVRAVLITGQPGIFTSGNDLEDFMQRPPQGLDSPVFQFMQALLACDKPVVVAVTGAAIGITMLILAFLVVYGLSALARRLIPRLLARGAVLAAVLFLLVPLLVACLLSFDDRSFLGAFPPRDFSLRWYRAFASNPTYMDGLMISLQLGLVAAAIATILGTMGALALMDPRLAGRDTLEAVFLSPKFIPTVVIGFSLLVFTAKLGIFDPFTRLVMGHVVITLPFTLRAVLASLVGVKRSQIEAAISLGASEARALWDVAVPAARSGIVAGAAM